MRAYATTIRYEKDWWLRKEQTQLRKALAGCQANPRAGMSRLLAESIESDLRVLRAEMERRKQRERP